jgi:hypothetical protein
MQMLRFAVTVCTDAIQFQFTFEISTMASRASHAPTACYSISASMWVGSTADVRGLFETIFKKLVHSKTAFEQINFFLSGREIVSFSINGKSQCSQRTENHRLSIPDEISHRESATKHLLIPRVCALCMYLGRWGGLCRGAWALTVRASAHRFGSREG